MPYQLSWFLRMASWVCRHVPCAESRWRGETINQRLFGCFVAIDTALDRPWTLAGCLFCLRGAYRGLSIDFSAPAPVAEAWADAHMDEFQLLLRQEGIADAWADKKDVTS